MTVGDTELRLRVQPEPEPVELAALLVALRRHRSTRGVSAGAAWSAERWRREGRVASRWRPTAGWREVARSEGVGSSHGSL